MLLHRSRSSAAESPPLEVTVFFVLLYTYLWFETAKWKPIAEEVVEEEVVTEVFAVSDERMFTLADPNATLVADDRLRVPFVESIQFSTARKRQGGSAAPRQPKPTTQLSYYEQRNTSYATESFDKPKTKQTERKH